MSTDEWVEYERECDECGQVCYHYDNKPYSLDRVIYCGKHCHLYDNNEIKSESIWGGEGKLFRAKPEMTAPLLTFMRKRNWKFSSRK